MRYGFRYLRQVEERAAGDSALVLTAADILGVREIDVFRLAWHKWFGHRGEDRVIESAFATYMFNKDVPIWVRQFARDVIEAARRGRLQPQPHGLIRRRPEPPQNLPGGVYVGIVLAVVVLLVTAVATTPGPRQSAEMFCAGGQGLQHYARMAYAMSAIAPPECL